MAASNYSKFIIKRQFKKVSHSRSPKGTTRRYVRLRKSDSQSHPSCKSNFVTEKIDLRFYTDPPPLHKDFQPCPRTYCLFKYQKARCPGDTPSYFIDALKHQFADFLLKVLPHHFVMKLKENLQKQNILHRPLRGSFIILGKRGTNNFIAWFTFHALSWKHISKILKAIEKTALSLF